MKIIYALAAVAVSAALLLSVSGCATQKDVYSNAFSDMPEGAKYEFGPGYARYSDPDMMVDASYLSPAGLEVYFSRFREGIYSNPFTPVSFIVFSLSIENRGAKNVTFNPRMTHFVTEKREPVSPKDFSELYSDFMLADAEDVDERMEAFKASAYDTSETLRPGESVQRLIVFPRTEETVGGGVLLFSGLYVNDKSRAVTIQYSEDLSLPDGFDPRE